MVVVALDLVETQLAVSGHRGALLAHDRSALYVAGVAAASVLWAGALTLTRSGPIMFTGGLVLGGAAGNLVSIALWPSVPGVPDPIVAGGLEATQKPELMFRLGPFDLVMLEVGGLHPAWGDIHLGPKNALEALALLGGGPFLPIHWGTFSLAMHAWDQPAEALLELGPKAGARLVMPRLGEPVEPAHAEEARPWWRVVDATAREPEPDTSAATSLPKAMPWPMD